jgi:hypothetical protein
LNHRSSHRIRAGAGLLGALACALLVACSGAPVMQPNPAGDLAASDKPPAPPPEQAPVEIVPEAFDACSGRPEGSSCWLYLDDQPLNGDCAPVESDQRLACQTPR